MKQHPRQVGQIGQIKPKPQMPRQNNHCTIEVSFVTIVFITDPQFGQVVLTEESPLTLRGGLIGAATQSHTHRFNL